MRGGIALAESNCECVRSGRRSLRIAPAGAATPRPGRCAGARDVQAAGQRGGAFPVAVSGGGSASGPAKSETAAPSWESGAGSDLGDSLPGSATPPSAGQGALFGQARAAAGMGDRGASGPAQGNAGADLLATAHDDCDGKLCPGVRESRLVYAALADRNLSQDL